MNIKKNHSLSKLNSFKVDHEAKIFTEVNSSQDLFKTLKSKIFEKEKKIILGGGTNILFTENFNGLILFNNIKGIEIIEENKNEIKIKVGSGEIWDDFVSFCVNKDWSGIENLSLIPGSVGAAPIQNIGAYGVEVKDYIFKINGVDLDNKTKKTYNNSSCDFSYRNSIFKKILKNKFFITSVIFKLNKNHKFNLSYKDLQHIDKNNTSLNQIRNEIIKIRNAKLPNPKILGNAGSFFKNPIVDKITFSKLIDNYNDIAYYKVNNNSIKIPAAWLIEKCGWKGYSDNKIGVFKNHALVIVNHSSKSGKNILELSKKIKESVINKFNIILENEVNVF